MSITFRDLIDTHCGSIRGGWGKPEGRDPRQVLGSDGAGRADHGRL
ncbi:MAG: hypothetical protein R3C08_02930 [Hyphomonas sp.]